jgi:hypothetical protein
MQTFFWKYDSVNPNTIIQRPEPNYKKQNEGKTSFTVPKHHPHQQHTAVSDALLLAALCYCISCSEFLVLPYYVPRTIILEKRKN